MEAFQVNPNIILALNMLNDAGFDAYIVGGAVRDFILDLPVSDYDIATNANLDQAMEVFKDYECKKYISKNITIGVKLNHTYFELSTFKGNTIEEDLSNRDFSVNSLAYDPNIGLIDPYHGLSDLVSKRLRTIRDIDIVIKEDPIRILRAIRFYESRGLQLDSKLKDYILSHANLLKDVKDERIQKEINPILLSDKPSLYINEFKEVFFTLFPPLRNCYGFDQKCPKWHNLDIFNHIMKVLDSTKCDLVLRMSAFFHDMGKYDCYVLDENGIGHFYNHAVKSEEYARFYLTKYKYNKYFIDRVCHLVYFHDYPLVAKEKNVLRFIYQFGTKDLDLYLGLKRADILGQNPELYYRLDTIDQIQAIIKDIFENDRIITYRNLKINGDILVDLGYQGEEIGKALEIILKKVISKELKNNPDKLYEYALELKYHLKEIE